MAKEPTDLPLETLLALVLLDPKRQQSITFSQSPDGVKIKTQSPEGEVKSRAIPVPNIRKAGPLLAKSLGRVLAEHASEFLGGLLTPEPETAPEAKPPRAAPEAQSPPPRSASAQGGHVEAGERPAGATQGPPSKR